MKLTKKETEIAERMKALGVYKTEFDGTIRRYRKLNEEFETLYTKYKKSGYTFMVSGPQGMKKSPIVITLETLRRDLLALEDALGLTPKGLKALQEEPFKAERKRKSDGLI
ncbi:MAG: P27 family phage terminase small subunit [Clostridia bacterium]|nr:P27 family phage terminase small subunit [Clostridia bacterium]